MLRVYLDTTVISAAFDERTPDRQRHTQRFFESADQYECVVSELTVEELLRTPDIGRREQLLLMVHRFRHVEIDASMHLLASALVDADVLPPAYYDDALHIAAASMSQADVLLSWNFRHLVNRRRRAMVNLLLSTRGRPTMEIIAPPEL